MKAGDNKELFA